MMLSASAFAYDEARLTINVPSAPSFHVIVDGRNFSTQGNRITYSEIRPGKHTITIYKEGRHPSDTRRGGRSTNDREIVYASTVYVKTGSSPDHPRE